MRTKYVCNECGRHLHIDNFNGLFFCANDECDRFGVYLTREVASLYEEEEDNER